MEIFQNLLARMWKHYKNSSTKRRANKLENMCQQIHSKHHTVAVQLRLMRLHGCRFSFHQQLQQNKNTFILYKVCVCVWIRRQTHAYEWDKEKKKKLWHEHLADPNVTWVLSEDEISCSSHINRSTAPKKWFEHILTKAVSTAFVWVHYFWNG